MFNSPTITFVSSILIKNITTIPQATFSIISSRAAAWIAFNFEFSFQQILCNHYVNLSLGHNKTDSFSSDSEYSILNTTYKTTFLHVIMLWIIAILVAYNFIRWSVTELCNVKCKKESGPVCFTFSTLQMFKIFMIKTWFLLNSHPLKCQCKFLSLVWIKYRIRQHRFYTLSL